MKIGDLQIDIIRKNIRNVHLSVHPPTGRVRIAAPQHLGTDAIRAFVIGKLPWIHTQQTKLRAQERETPREYLDRESHYVWGRRCLLRLIERDTSPSVEWQLNRLTLVVRPEIDTDRRAEILDEWYREQLRTALNTLADEWEQRMGVKASAFFVQRMRTRWGSCNRDTGTVRLNTDLAKKPRECLEYILVHELAHLLVPTHNARFVALMDQYLPGWPSRRELLNRLPVRHDDWTY